MRTRIKNIFRWVVGISLVVSLGGAFVLPIIPAFAQGIRRPIVIEEITETLSERFDRAITLDVREMNIVDVIKFLSLKGDFNMVTSDQVDGRVTLYLKNVSIRDALDIILISNNLAYYSENDIVHILSGLEYEEMFGKKFNDKLEVEVIHLQYAKPSYILAALDNIKSSLGRIIIDEDSGSVVLVDTKQVLEEMKKSINRMEVPAEVFVYPLQYASADIVVEKLKSRIDAHAVGSITADERSNKIIIRAQPGRRKEVEDMIKTLDVAVKEVLVEAKVLQITFKPQYDFGIDWEKDFRDNTDHNINKLSFKNIFLDEANLSSSDNLSTTFGKVGFGDITTDQFDVAVRALKQVSDTKILSEPKLLVTNNEEAKIHVGDTVPYIISTTSGTGDNAITSEEVRFVDVGLKLNVTPTINDEGMVIMRLKPEISTVSATITSKGGGIPQVNKTLVETTVMVPDGDTIIIGGLKKDDKVHVSKGVPYLMDIPYFGQIFRSASDSITETEIVIFITPHIIKGGEDPEVEGTIKPTRSLQDDFDKTMSQALTIKE